MIPWRLEIFDELGSTSDLCVTRAKAGEPEGLAILAKIQTSGRGSRGRTWQAPAGNLNLSLLLRPGTPAALAGMFSLAAGIAVAEALESFFAPPTTLKWPNDILTGGAKLAGILIDAAPNGTVLDWLVIGIGLNLRVAPKIPGRITTSLSAHGVDLEPEPLAHAILASLALWHAASPETIRQEWLARAHPIGTPIEISGPGEPRSGTFAGLSPAGELLLQRKNRIDPISTGEILLGRV